MILNMDEVFSSEEMHDMHDTTVENLYLRMHYAEGLTNQRGLSRGLSDGRRERKQRMTDERGRRFIAASELSEQLSGEDLTG